MVFSLRTQLKRFCLTLTPVLLSLLSRRRAAWNYVATGAALVEEHCTDCHSAGDADGDLPLELFEALKGR